MATALGSAKVGLSISAILRNILDGRSVDDPVNFNPSLVFDNGTGLNQANKVFFDTRTLSASANEDIDLAGGLVDAFGNTLTFTKIKALAIQALPANTNNVNVTRPASNGTPFFLAAGDGLALQPGGLFLFVAPTAAGVTVTASTGDLLNIANSAGSTSVTFNIFILGTV